MKKPIDWSNVISGAVVVVGYAALMAFAASDPERAGGPLLVFLSLMTVLFAAGIVDEVRRRVRKMQKRRRQTQ